MSPHPTIASFIKLAPIEPSIPRYDPTKGVNVGSIQFVAPLVQGLPRIPYRTDQSPCYPVTFARKQICAQCGASFWRDPTLFLLYHCTSVKSCPHNRRPCGQYFI